jgi:tellurite resistance protein TehA-like permease
MSFSLRGSAYCGLFISRYSENDILPVTRAAATSSDHNSHFSQGSAASRKQADSLPTRLETFVAGTHSICFLIEVFALQALLHNLFTKSVFAGVWTTVGPTGLAGCRSLKPAKKTLSDIIFDLSQLPIIRS